MVRRLPWSFCKPNSYFTFGTILGLLIVLAIDTEDEIIDCDEAKREMYVNDDYEPAYPPRSPTSSPSSGGMVLRPRYYSSELGVRDAGRAAAGLLSSRSDLLEAHNSTLQSLPSLRLFVSASSATYSNTRNVVGFTDSREMLRPFHAIKYLADNHLDEFDFFFLATDSHYINARRLNELVSKISVSRDLYMGIPDEENNQYCRLESGIIVSNSVIRAVQSALDWCVRNSYSLHHHENIGRCVLHATNTPCQKFAQGEEYKWQSGDQLHEAMAEAVSIGPLMDQNHLYQIHAFVTRVYLERVQKSIWTNSSLSFWPPGLKLDAPPTNTLNWNRFDVLRWTLFNSTVVYMPDDETNIGPLAGAHKQAIQLVMQEVTEWCKANWSEDVVLEWGAFRWVPATHIEYRLFLKTESGKFRLIEAIRALGASRAAVVPYVTESSRVTLMPIDLGHGDMTFTRLLSNDTALLILASPQESHSQAVVSLIQLATKRGVSVRLSDSNAYTANGKGALLFIFRSQLKFDVDLLNRVRMNTIRNEQWFWVVPFSKFQFPGNKSGTGRFDARAAPIAISVYAEDLDRALNRPDCPVDNDSNPLARLARCLVASGLRVIKAPEVKGEWPAEQRVPVGYARDIGLRRVLASLVINSL